MRPHLLVLFLFLCSTVLTTDGRLQARDSAAADTPTLQASGSEEDPLSEEWVVPIDRERDVPHGVALNGAGHVFTVGHTKDSSFKEWAFLSNHDGAGTEVCVDQFGYSPTFNERAHDVALDSKGNIYIVGFTSGTNFHAWLTKYDQDCQEKWSFNIAPNSTATAVAVDTDDNVYVGGYTPDDLDGTNAGGLDAWLAKYDTDGNQIWVEQFGTTSSDYLHGIAFDSASEVYVTGIYGSGVNGGQDIWIANYQSDGTLDWSETLGTPRIDYGYDIAIDSADNLFITGLTQGDLEGTGTLAGNRGFVARYDSAGNLQWVRQHDEGPFNAIATSLITPQVYVIGQVSAAGGGDVVVGSYYDSEGTTAWIQQMGTERGDNGTSIATAPNNDLYIAGTANGEWASNTIQGAFVAKLKERLPEPRIEAQTPGVSIENDELPVGVKHPLLRDSVVKLLGGEASANIDVNCLTNLIGAISLFTILTDEEAANENAFVVGAVLAASLDICAKKAGGPAVLSASETPPMELALQEGSLLFEVEEALLHLHVETANATVQSLGGNDFEVAYDPTMDKTTITAYSGSVTVVPSNPALEPFGLGPFEQVVIDDSSTSPIQSIGSVLYLPFVRK